MIEIAGFTQSYGEGEARHEVLRGIDLELDQGDFVAVAAPSGSGKSTLIRCIAGLESATCGSIRIDGAELHGLCDDARTLLRRDRIGMLGSDPMLLPDLTVLENVALPRLLRGDEPGPTLQLARELCAEFGLGDRLEHKASRLGRLDQSRCALARALINEPVLLLVDEATAALDLQDAVSLVEAVHRANAAHEMCVLLVSDNPKLVAKAKRRMELRGGTLHAPQPVVPVGETAAEAIAREASAISAAKQGTPPAETNTAADTGAPKSRPSSKGAELLAQIAQKKKSNSDETGDDAAADNPDQAAAAEVDQDGSLTEVPTVEAREPEAPAVQEVPVVVATEPAALAEASEEPPAPDKEPAEVDLPSTSDEAPTAEPTIDVTALEDQLIAEAVGDLLPDAGAPTEAELESESEPESEPEPEEVLA